MKANIIRRVELTAQGIHYTLWKDGALQWEMLVKSRSPTAQEWAFDEMERRAGHLTAAKRPLDLR